jgi:hypothetical protein
MADDVDDFLKQNSKKGVPGYSFLEVGDSVVGTITDRQVVEVPVIGSKTGEKQKKLVLSLRTDKEYSQTKRDKETGQPVVVTGNEWSLWIAPGQMLSAISNAVRDANAPEGSPRIGDRLAVKFTGTEPSKTPGFNPKKVYEASYKVSAEVASAAPSVEDLL